MKKGIAILAALTILFSAAALAENLPYADALRLAAAASALAVQRPGAAPSIPPRGEAEAFLKGTR